MKKKKKIINIKSKFRFFSFEPNYFCFSKKFSLKFEFYMKFWLIDIEKEFYLDHLSKTVVVIGVIGYLSLWVFILLFTLTQASTEINKVLMVICYCALFVLIFFATYCKIRHKINIRFVIPNLEENDQERLSSNNNIPETKKRSEFPANSLENNMSQNKISWNLISGICLTVITLTHHSFIYVYMTSSDISLEYHIIFMVNLAFPVTVSLVCFSMISANILYNIWVDTDFAVDYLKKCFYKTLLFNVYFTIGWIFLLFVYISALFSSFCGMVNGDYDSTVVFVVWMCTISLFLLIKLFKKYCYKIVKRFTLENN